MLFRALSSAGTNQALGYTSQQGRADLRLLRHVSEDNEVMPADISSGSGPQPLSMPFSAALLFPPLP